MLESLPAIPVFDPDISRLLRSHDLLGSTKENVTQVQCPTQMGPGQEPFR